MHFFFSTWTRGEILGVPRGEFSAPAVLYYIQPQEREREREECRAGTIHVLRIQYHTGTWTLRPEVQNSLSGMRLTVERGGCKGTVENWPPQPQIKTKWMDKKGLNLTVGSTLLVLTVLVLYLYHTVPYWLGLGTCLPALFAVFTIRKVKHYSTLYVSEPVPRYCHDKIGFAGACIMTWVA